MSGRSSTTWRSNRPGRSSAGSRTSGRFVAAIFYPSAQPRANFAAEAGADRIHGAVGRPAGNALPRARPALLVGQSEGKIELDRRRINTRMAKLRREIAGFAPARDAKRANRKRGEVPSVAIAGYTNAGKSSLLNRLTGAESLVQNQLFATLDTTVRHAETADGRRFTYADTVGFVRQLPHQLVEAFRSTFEEVADADVIVHVVDGSHPDPAAQLRTVRDVIAEVDAQGIPEVVVFNKSDLLDETQRLVLHGLVPDAVFVSARTGAGIEELQRRIEAALPVPDREVTVVVPYDRGDLVSELHERNRVLDTDYIEDGTRLHAYVGGETFAKLEPYLVARV